MLHSVIIETIEDKKSVLFEKLSYEPLLYNRISLEKMI